MFHNVVHHIRHPAHIPGILQKRKSDEEDRYIGQERQNASNSGDDAIAYQVDDPGGCVHGFEQRADSLREPVNQRFQPPGKPVPHIERECEHEPHDRQENQNTPERPKHHFIHFVGERIACFLPQQHLRHDFFNCIVFPVDDAVTEIRGSFGQVRVSVHDFRIMFQKRQSRKPGIVCTSWQPLLQIMDAVLDIRCIFRHKLQLRFPVHRPWPVVGGICIFVLMQSCVQQSPKALLFPGHDRYHRNTQELLKTMQIQVDAPFLHDIHHVQCQDRRFAEFYELQGEIQGPFQAGGIGHINDHIHLVRKNELP